MSTCFSIELNIFIKTLDILIKLIYSINTVKKQKQKGEIIMTKQEKKVAQALLDAFKVLPDEKKEYLLGYADGVIAIANQQPAPEQ